MNTRKELHERWSRDPDCVQAHGQLEPEFKAARAFIGARKCAGFTRAEPAARMKTTLSAAARLESSRAPQCTRSPAKVAKATGTRLRVRLEAA